MATTCGSISTCRASPPTRSTSPSSATSSRSTAERSYQREEGDRVYVGERHEGTYRRQVTLGEGLDADGIEADYTDGVLTLRIPVVPQAQPRKITVGTGQLAVDTTAVDTTATTPTAADPPPPPFALRFRWPSPSKLQRKRVTAVRA